MRYLAPSMLSADFLNLSKDVECVNKLADLFHLDVMDGSFVPNISFGFPIIEAIKKEAKLPLDVHLMIVEPQKYFERFVKAGASMLSFHLEAAWKANQDPGLLLKQIKSLGAKSGLVINPDVPVEKVFPYLADADFILIMSVFAGFGGQKFIDTAFSRINILKEEIIRQGVNCFIEVDGGVSLDNAEQLFEAGAEVLVAGSSFFNAKDRDSFAKQIKGVI